MWLFTVHGFYSVSVLPGSPKTCVRARLRKHLEALRIRFKLQYDIVRTDGCDYLYRMLVPKKVWAGVVKELTAEQTWSNFKRQAAKVNGRDAYERALHEVWEVMFELQRKETYETRLPGRSPARGRKQPKV